jgi:hypothetical protein
MQEIPSGAFKVRNAVEWKARDPVTTDRDRPIEQLLRQAHPTPATGHDCPDAETLAACADDALTAPARREVEGHIAACDRCQALIAAMVRAAMPSGVSAGEAAPAGTHWRRALNWLVPAAAAATAVALWVLVPGQRTPLPEAPRQAQETTVASAPGSFEAPPTVERLVEEPLRIPSDAPADDAARERETNALQSARPGPAARGDMAQTGDAAELQNRVGQANPPAAPREGPIAEAAPAAPPAAAAPPLPAAMARRAEAVASFEVISPTPRFRWRIGPGALVQYSADEGATWTPQPTGMSVPFTAGTAPSAEVCWLVGRAGLVLRTTDAGRQWQQIAFPEMVDLAAVDASSALDATVVLADGRRFATTDGGRTWTP